MPSYFTVDEPELTLAQLTARLGASKASTHTATPLALRARRELTGQREAMHRGLAAAAVVLGFAALLAAVVIVVLLIWVPLLVGSPSPKPAA